MPDFDTRRPPGTKRPSKLHVFVVASGQHFSAVASRLHISTRALSIILLALLDVILIVWAVETPVDQLGQEIQPQPTPAYRAAVESDLSNRAPRGHAPYVRAEWLEETVWADVRQFLRDPGAVLERVREQMGSGGASAELEERRAELSKRLAGKHKERDRWLHLYAQGHISDAELETHLTDLRAQIGNLTLLLESVEDELKAQREYVQVAETTEAWLLRLKARVEEVEGDSPEAYQKRRKLVKLLVAGITAGKHDDGSRDVRITYRFGPPEPFPEEDVFASGVENGPAQLALKHSSNCAGEISRMPPI